jgi:hypothetical protein
MGSIVARSIGLIKLGEHIDIGTCAVAQCNVPIAARPLFVAYIGQWAVFIFDILQIVVRFVDDTCTPIETIETIETISDRIGVVCYNKKDSCPLQNFWLQLNLAY